MRSQVEHTVRTIEELTITREGPEIVIRVSGNGFLYNMVRHHCGNADPGRKRILRTGESKRDPGRKEADERRGDGPTGRPGFNRDFIFLTKKGIQMPIKWAKIELTKQNKSMGGKRKCKCL